MQSTQETSLIQRSLDTLYKNYPLIMPIVQSIWDNGGNVLLVGGAVRDFLWGLPVSDIDFEVYGISLDKLQKILSDFGPVSMVGSSFGVLKLHGLDVDWTLPRSDSVGRKPLVTVDPHMSYADAFVRRDLTINAMGFDLKTGELIDPYGGYADLQNKILRAPDLKKFVEDPLRLYRVMQFVGRFDATVDPALQAVCSTMNVATVSRERIEAEFEKLVLKSVGPSRGIRWLREIDILQKILPDLYSTIGVLQRPDFHPEGDVFEHLMQSLDAAAVIVRAYETPYKKLLLLYAAVCHDLGKQDVTVWKDNRWRSTGHALAGVPRTKTMLARITMKKKLVAAVCVLVEHHMAPGVYGKDHAKPASYKKLAHELSPLANCALLADLAMADRRGRNDKSQIPLSESDEHVLAFIAVSKKLGVFEAPERPLLQGRDFVGMDIHGAHLGKLLAYAYDFQLRHTISSKEELKNKVLQTWSPQSSDEKK